MGRGLDGVARHQAILIRYPVGLAKFCKSGVNAVALRVEHTLFRVVFHQQSPPCFLIQIAQRNEQGQIIPGLVEDFPGKAVLVVMKTGVIRRFFEIDIVPHQQSDFTETVCQALGQTLTENGSQEVGWTIARFSIDLFSGMHVHHPGCPLAGDAPRPTAPVPASRERQRHSLEVPQVVRQTRCQPVMILKSGEQVMTQTYTGTDMAIGVEFPQCVIAENASHMLYPWIPAESLVRQYGNRAPIAIACSA